jgi:hypothetical protein
LTNHEYSLNDSDGLNGSFAPIGGERVPQAGQRGQTGSHLAEIPPSYYGFMAFVNPMGPLSGFEVTDLSKLLPKMRQTQALRILNIS